MSWSAMGDLAVVDQRQNVMLVSPDGQETKELTDAFRSELRHRELQGSYGQARRCEAVWRLPLTPELAWFTSGALLIDGQNAAWLVCAVTYGRGGAGSRCRAVRLELSNAAAATITIERGTESPSSRGVAESTWEPILASTLGWLQVVVEQQERLHERMRNAQQARLLLWAELPSDPLPWRVLHAGARYRVAKVLPAGSLEEPHVLELVRWDAEGGT